MSKWVQFWSEVANDIEEEYGRGIPSEWDEGDIEEFLRHFDKTVISKMIEDEELASNCGIKYQGSSIEDWKSMVPSTFRRIFSYRSSTGNKSTRNSFAIYLGFRSGEDYIHKRVLHESVPKQKVQNTKDGFSKTHKLIESHIDQPIPVVLELSNANFKKEDKYDEWMIYELAFLWHEKEPPSIQAHKYQMTRDIEKTKMNLHKSVESGLLQARTEVSPNSLTRFVTRNSLEEYIKSQELDRPEFLKRELRSGE